MKNLKFILTAIVTLTLTVTAALCQDSLNVTKVCEVVFWDGLYEITHSGNYVYAVAREEGLHIIDVSDPQNPTEMGCFNTPGSAEEIVLSGNIAYIADNEGGLRLVDITDPTDPTEIGFYNTPGSTYGLEVRDTLAYLADGSGGFRIIDVSNPSNPIETAHYSTPQWDPGVTNVALNGDYAYLTFSECECGWGGKLYIFDISNPSVPTLIDTLSTWYYGRSAEVHNNYLYVAAHFYGVYIYDISDPFNVQQVSNVPSLSEAEDVFISDSILYVCATYNLITTLDISNPATPQIIGYGGAGANPHCISVSDTLAFVGGWQQGLTVLDVSNPANLTTVSNLSRSVSFGDLAISGGYAYVTNREIELCVFDISPPENTYFVTGLTLTDVPDGIDVEGDNCFISGDGGTLFIINISNPANPFITTATDLNYSLGGIDVDGGYAFITISWDGLLVVDVSDVNDPQIVSHVIIAGRTDEVKVLGDRAYAAVHNSGLVIIDITDPTSPSILGAYSYDNIRDVSVSGDMAYIIYNFLYAIDVSNPYYPTLSGQLEPAGSFRDLAAIGDYVFLVFNHGGLKVIDVSNPSAMAETGFYDINDYVYKIAVSGDYSYFSAHNIFMVLNHSAATSIDNNEPVTIPREFALSAPYPNPFNPTTILTYHLPHAGMVELRVYDILGRHVADLVNDWHYAGTYRALFDASYLPSGIYFARLTAGKFQQTQKLLLVK